MTEQEILDRKDRFLIEFTLSNGISDKLNLAENEIKQYPNV